MERVAGMAVLILKLVADAVGVCMTLAEASMSLAVATLTQRVSTMRDLLALFAGLLFGYVMYSL